MRARPALLLLVAAGGGVVWFGNRVPPDLSHLEERLEGEKARDTELAGHLEESRREAGETRTELSRIGLFFLDDADAATALKTVEAGAGGAQVSWSKEAGFTLTGRGGTRAALSSLVHLSSTVPGLTVGKVELGEDSWSAALTLDPSPPTVPAAAALEPVPAPPLCILSCRRHLSHVGELRREIAALEGRLGSEVQKLTRQKARLDYERMALEADPRRLRSAARDLEGLFGASGVMASGSFSPQGPVEGSLVRGVDASALVIRLPKGWEIAEVSPGHARLTRRKD